MWTENSDLLTQSNCDFAIVKEFCCEIILLKTFGLLTDVSSVGKRVDVGTPQ